MSVVLLLLILNLPIAISRALSSGNGGFNAASRLKVTETGASTRLGETGGNECLDVETSTNPSL
jgi:hypothetical protein